MERDKKNTPATAVKSVDKTVQNSDDLPKKAVDGEMLPEVNGPKGPEPTRYGDWEKDGIISDF